MRRAVTFAVTGENFRLVHGPEVPLRDQVADFKRSVENPPSGVESLEIWENSSLRKRKKFSAPAAPVAVEPPLLSTEESAKSKKSKS